MTAREGDDGVGVPGGPGPASRLTLPPWLRAGAAPPGGAAPGDPVPEEAEPGDAVPGAGASAPAGRHRPDSRGDAGSRASRPSAPNRIRVGGGDRPETPVEQPARHREPLAAAHGDDGARDRLGRTRFRPGGLADDRAGTEPRAETAPPAAAPGPGGTARGEAGGETPTTVFPVVRPRPAVPRAPAPRRPARPRGPRRSRTPLLAVAGLALFALCAGLGFLVVDGFSASDDASAAATPDASDGAGCLAVQEPGHVVGDGPGSLDTPLGVVLAFDHAYYVERSADRAFEAVAPGARMDRALLASEGIDRLPAGTRHCVDARTVGEGRVAIALTETAPDSPPRVIHQDVRLERVAGDRWGIASITPGS